MDEIRDMLNVAEDWEADVIDNLRERAGITWTHQCPTMSWTNLTAEGDICDNCGGQRERENA